MAEDLLFLIYTATIKLWEEPFTVDFTEIQE